MSPSPGPAPSTAAAPTGGPGPSAPPATSPRPRPAASSTAAPTSSSSTAASASSSRRSRSPTPRCSTSSRRTSPTSPSNASRSAPPWDGSGPNTDAIDPGPVTRAWIHHCDIDTGDDDIVIKSGGTDILIEDNTIRHGHGISIGSETTVGVHNMLVRRCTFEGTDNGIRIKSMRGAGGLVENIRYTDITMKNVAEAITLQLDYVDNNRPDFKGDPTKIPAIRNILIDNITIEGSRRAGVIHGIPDSPITNITLRDITLTAEKDFDIRDATAPVFERVTRTIKAGVGPRKLSGEH
ncbi:MAG: glycosyl hydrolase family 28 protein [Verrucomicrobia bacterium]|nr:glycosyl hydrolase family 28 protein [Verrucomicrobiota bacterium]